MCAERSVACAISRENIAPRGRLSSVYKVYVMKLSSAVFYMTYSVFLLIAFSLARRALCLLVSTNLDSGHSSPTNAGLRRA